MANPYEDYLKTLFPVAYKEVAYMFGKFIVPKVISIFEKYGIQREHATSYAYAICAPIYKAYIISERRGIQTPASHTAVEDQANLLTEQVYPYIQDDIELDVETFIEISNKVVQTIPDADHRLIHEVWMTWISGIQFSQTVQNAQAGELVNELVVVTDSFVKFVNTALALEDDLIALGRQDLVDAQKNFELTPIEPSEFSSNIFPVRTKKKRPRT